MSDDTFRRLQRDFGQWLAGRDWSWSHFGTFTFSKTPGKRAISHFDAYLRDMAGLFRLDRFVGFVSMEIGPHRGREHLHALLEAHGVAACTLEREWENRYGFARIRPYNPQMGGIKYVCKYVLKDACNAADWRLYTYGADDPNEGLFEPAARRTGYQLYTRWRTELDGKRGA